MATGRDTKLTGATGEYLVAAELCRLGLVAAPSAEMLRRDRIRPTGRTSCRAGQDHQRLNLAVRHTPVSRRHPRREATGYRPRSTRAVPAFGLSTLTSRLVPRQGRLRHGGRERLAFLDDERHQCLDRHFPLVDSLVYLSGRDEEGIARLQRLRGMAFQFKVHFALQYVAYESAGVLVLSLRPPTATKASARMVS